MVNKTASFLTLLLLISISLCGCKQYYNGAFGMGTSDYNTVNEYHRQREQRLIEEDQQQARLAAQADAAAKHEQPESPNATEPVIYPDQSDQPERPGDDWQGVLDQPQPYASTDPEQPNHYPTGDQTSPRERVSSPIDIFGGMGTPQGKFSPLDSTGQLRRISLTNEGADFDVTLDKAGEHLIYSSTRHRKTSDIYRQRIEGSAITQLTDDESNDVMPALSPDGKTIAFASDRSGNWDLYLMDADGKLHEKVYDVAWSGDREADANGNVPEVGNTVDLETASWSNTIGASELMTVWTDPDFDANERAFYYVRVLEIPTPRWVVYDKVRYGIELPEEAQLIHQERAYSSPIWYTPG